MSDNLNQLGAWLEDNMTVVLGTAWALQGAAVLFCIVKVLT